MNTHLSLPLAHHSRRTLAPLAVAALLSLLPSCTSSRQSADAVPEDFWLSLTVMAPSTDPAADRAHTPARYLIESDCVLRAAVGPGASENSLTSFVRPLSQQQVINVYADTQDIRASELQPVSIAPTRDNLGDRRLIVLSLRERGFRRTYLIDPAINPDHASRAYTLADRLAELAWRK